MGKEVWVTNEKYLNKKVSVRLYLHVVECVYVSYQDFNLAEVPGRGKEFYFQLQTGEFSLQYVLLLCWG